MQLVYQLLLLQRINLMSVSTHKLQRSLRRTHLKPAKDKGFTSLFNQFIKTEIQENMKILHDDS